MWTANELEKKLKAGKIRGITDLKAATIVKKGISEGASAGMMAKGESNKYSLLQLLELLSERYSLVVLTEYVFAAPRQYRADFALLSPGGKTRILVEYEGIVLKAGEKSRHTTKAGFTEDCNKYNLAQTNGFTLLRYTSSNYENITSDVITILMRKS